MDFTAKTEPSRSFRTGKDPICSCGVLASAVGMDKLYTKIIVNNLGIRQADYEPVMSEQLADMDAVTARIEAHLHTLYLSTV